jgi:biotin transport system substrate-specific component
MSVTQITQKSLSTTQIEILKVVIGVALLFAGAQLSIPLKPIPITLHTVAVLLIGLTYKPREAFASVSSYLFLGALGAPVFAAYNGGLIYMLGKTGGYLAGFLVAVMVISWLQQSMKRRLLQTLLLSVIGHGIIFAMGVGWLATFIGLKSAIAFGFMPFIIPGLIKAGLLTATLQGIRYFDKGPRS